VIEDKRVINKVDHYLLDEMMAEIDMKISLQLDEILHHPALQKLESLWRGLDYVLVHSSARDQIQVEVLDVSKSDLQADFQNASDYKASGLYQHVYIQEYDTPGGEPFATMITDESFDKSPEDIALLGEIAKVAAEAHCPFIANVGASFFDKHSFDEVMNIQDIRTYLEKAEYIRWQSFRRREEARYIGLTLPKFLLRLPYGDETVKVKPFFYEEQVSRKDASRYLWGAASFAFAANVSRSFREYGWTVNIRGPESGGRVDDLPLHQYDWGLGLQTQIPTESAISETRELTFSDMGFISLSYYKNSDFACFFSAQSLQAPGYHDDPDVQANIRINSRLPYIYLVSRLAHYMKVLQRENIGSQKSKDHLERDLNAWLGNLVTKSNHPTPDIIAKYPLAAAEVNVHEIPDNPGYYQIFLNIVPHFQVEGMDITLSLVSKLPKTNNHNKEG
jgi:type VI secretion system protein ImpC